MFDTPLTIEETIGTEAFIVDKVTEPWSKRRAALFRAVRAFEDFNRRVNERISVMRESLGNCPCCPTRYPGGCMIKHFRQVNLVHGEWDGTETWEPSPPHHKRAEWYASQLTMEESARFWRAIRGADRITVDDYNRIARTIQTLLETGGWKSVIPSA